MRLYPFLPALAVQLLLSFVHLNAQSWEIFFEDPTLNNSFYGVASPTLDNGVRLIAPDVVNSTVPPIVYSFDETGEYTGQSPINWATNWDLANIDQTGASYWVTFYKLRKMTADNQIAWTYSPPVTAGIFWEYYAPNGGVCLQYMANNSTRVIDYVNASGQLVHRFEFPVDWPDTYYPGYDNSLIYTHEDSHWIKVNQDDQIAWELDLSTNVRFLSGSLPDGTTYCVNDNTNILTKISAAGVIEWERNVEDYFPDNNLSHTDALNRLVRQDGSIILCIGRHEILPASQNSIYFININPSNGNPIWMKRTASTLKGSIYPSGPMMEMPDGGILACFGPVSWNPPNKEFFIVRTDPNGNTLTSQISGKIFWDENNDCIEQPGEKALKQISVIAKSGTKKYSATTDGSGHFSMATAGGDYALSLSQPGSYWSYCDFPNPVSVDAYNDTVWSPIGAKATVICPEMAISVGSPGFRRCFDNNNLIIYYQNFGTAPAADAYLTVTLDTKLIYLSASAPLLSQSGQTYTFDLGTVDVGGSGILTINIKVDCDVELGELLCADSHIYPDTLCVATASKMSSNQICLPVVSSFDPNDKTAFVNGKPETVKILPNSGLEYLIRFQNTGTDTAFNVVIADTLSDQLDPTSVVPGASSHPYSFELRNGNILRFNFRNILLPDSNVNEPLSHGFVKFMIRQKTDNPIGSTLSNRAAIFFDYNAPVITNESLLVVSSSVGTQAASVALQAKTWPVPAHDEVRVVVPTATSGIVSWKLVDPSGRIMRTGSKEAASFSIGRQGLPAGIYWCQMTLQNGTTAVGRIVFD